MRVNYSEIFPPFRHCCDSALFNAPLETYLILITFQVGGLAQLKKLFSEIKALFQVPRVKKALHCVKKTCLLAKADREI